MVREFTNRAKQLDLKVEIPMDGNLLSEFAVIAEAGGEQEQRMRIPLVGGSGQFLWKATHKKLGMRRTDFYISNVIKRQVSLTSKGNERITIPKHELEQWKALLLWELQQLPNVRYILCLGAVCLEALMPHLYDDDGKKFSSTAGITMWRGSVATLRLSDREIRVLITFNPAYILREPKNEIVFHFDIGKFKRLIDDKYKPYNITHHINPSFREAIDWIDAVQDAEVPTAYDIETVSGETACVGLAVDNHEGFCINLRTVDANRFSLFEERAIVRRLQTLFACKDTQFIAQNGVFDAAWLWFKDGIRVHANWFDTLLAHHTLYSSLPHSLTFLTAQYTNHPFYKDEGKTWKEGGDIDIYWRYNVKDTCLTRYIAFRQLAELKKFGLDKFFFDHVMRLQPHLVHMIVGGIKCDVDLKQHIIDQLRNELADQLKSYYEAVHEATGEDDYYPNPLSWQQLQGLFFCKLRLVGRGTSTGADNRKRMRSHPRTTPAAAKVLDRLDVYKKDQKFFSTYADSTIDDDKRFRCEYRQFGTQQAPGRLSSAQTAWNTGLNLQNQPERSKSMFITDDGYAFGYFDLEQAEARFVGWDANIAKWIDDFERARHNPGSYDCHRALASQMFNVPYDEVPTKDFNEDGTHTMRFIGKQCRHALNYRMGILMLATKTGLPYYEAERVYHLYHKITPELKADNGWWATIERTIKRDKILYNAYGRRLIILERLTDEALESIVAFRPQSSIGDKVNRVIYKSHEDDKWPMHAKVMQARMALNIHDALICLAPVDKVKTCLSIMKKHAEEPMRWPCIMTGEMTELIIPAECKMTKQRTLWRLDDEGKLEFYDDDNGYYRWSHLDKVEVEKAA